MASIVRRRAHRIWRLLPSAKRLRTSIALTGFGPFLLNLIVQRIFRVNGAVPWMVHYTSRVILPQHITIGESVWTSFAVSGGCYIQAGNGIVIGDHTRFAPGVKIISANHDPENLDEWLSSPPIKIGRCCWIGANAIILPGVELGDASVVGAGAVVTKSFPSGSIVAGVPARLIGGQPPQELQVE